MKKGNDHDLDEIPVKEKSIQNISGIKKKKSDK